jgi:hypothetical protein
VTDENRAESQRDVVLTEAELDVVSGGQSSTSSNVQKKLHDAQSTVIREI